MAHDVKPKALGQNAANFLSLDADIPQQHSIGREWFCLPFRVLMSSPYRNPHN
jgi:hypothetical protein